MTASVTEPHPQRASPPGSTLEVIAPQVVVFRLFDLADEIDLSRLAGERLPLLRSRSGAVQFGRPPVTLDLGRRTLEGASGVSFEGQLSARVYDFGVCGLRWRVSLGDRLPWDAFAARVSELFALGRLDSFFDHEVGELESRIEPALLRPVEERIVEELGVFLLEGVRDLAGDAEPGTGEPVAVEPARSLLDRPEVVSLVLGETEPMAAEVRQDLERHAFSYTRRDLAVLGFDRVLVLDPAGIWDVADLVEFAHAELIELRFYHRLLDSEIRRLPEVFSRARGLGSGSHGRLRRRLMQRLAEISEVRSRLDSALDITEDLFYARIFRKAMSLYGARELADALEEKTRVITEVYGMVSEEVNTRIAHALELGIFLLVLIEVVRAFIP